MKQDLPPKMLSRLHPFCFQALTLILILTIARVTFFHEHSHARELDLVDLVRIQKENYKAHQWSALFGTAQAYRMGWWQDYPSLTLISLETLGLIKLCRYQEAETLLVSAPIPPGSTPEELRQRESLLTFLGARKSVGMKLQPPARAKSTFKKRPELFWPLKDVTHLVQELPPASFRVKVENLCRK